MPKKKKLDEEMKKLEEKLLDLAKEKGVHAETLRSIIEDEKHPTTFPTLDLSKYVRKNTLEFGILSDTCFNSKFQRLDHIHNVYRHFEEEKVPFVLHCGNLLAKFIQKKDPSENFIFLEYFDIVKALDKWMPKIGVDTFFIGGRNEASYKGKKVQRYDEELQEDTVSETDIPLDVEGVRSDLKFAGWHNARIRLTNKVTVAMASPPSGSRKPYTISHPMQRLIESYGGGEKPTIQLLGYYNKSWEGPHRGVIGIMVPTLQKQPPQEYSTAEPSHTLGAYILKLRFKNDGSLAENGVTKRKLVFYE